MLDQGASTRARRPCAETSYGRVRGQKTSEGLVFRDVSFAAAPVGDLRFRAPRRPRRWAATRDCLSFGPSCPQPPFEQTLFAPIAAVGLSDEACLSLNVWTPGLDDALRPTMVWIHGGGFVWGSAAAPLYDGSAFSRDGVVFVSLNYRLNAFGFMCFDDLFEGLPGSGNLGLLDQIMALEWVQENIRAFGGNPDNVTIFGESAGGCSVAELMAAPRACGLFQRAIIQSGVIGCHSRAGATAVAKRALDILGIKAGDLETLQGLSAARLVSLIEPLRLEAAELLGNETSGAIPKPFMPVIDGEVLVAPAHERLGDGMARSVDLLIGWCADELTAYVADPASESATFRLRQLVGDHLGRNGVDAAQVSAVYRQVWPSPFEGDVLIRVLSDLNIRLPSLQLASQQSIHSDTVWMFEFAWPTPVAGGRLGAPHTLEIPFVFDNMVAPDLHGPTPPQALARSVHRAWVTFAQTGDPKLGGEAPPWPAWSAERPYAMALKDEFEMLPVLHPALASLWNLYAGDRKAARHD